MGQKGETLLSISSDTGQPRKLCSDIVAMLGDFILDALLEVNFCGSSVIWYDPLTVLTRCLETCR